mmetsp:Transcript_117697/g.340285  ORF Transcript_117697/g.340285 Transcript_117697/m.340285 type:complete len:352 (-) Transcript_117697:1350-2405(-)
MLPRRLMSSKARDPPFRTMWSPISVWICVAVNLSTPTNVTPTSTVSALPHKNGFSVRKQVQVPAPVQEVAGSPRNASAWHQLMVQPLSALFLGPSHTFSVLSGSSKLWPKAIPLGVKNFFTLALCTWLWSSAKSSGAPVTKAKLVTEAPMLAAAIAKVASSMHQRHLLRTFVQVESDFVLQVGPAYGTSDTDASMRERRKVRRQPKCRRLWSTTSSGAYIAPMRNQANVTHTPMKKPNCLKARMLDAKFARNANAVVPVVVQEDFTAMEYVHERRSGSSVSTSLDWCQKSVYTKMTSAPKPTIRNKAKKLAKLMVVVPIQTEQITKVSGTADNAMMGPQRARSKLRVWKAA